MICRFRYSTSKLLLGFALIFFSAAAQAQSFAEQVVEQVNLQRWLNGQLPPHKLDGALAVAAQAHSQNMASRNFLMHCDPDTQSQPWDRMTAAGYNWNSAGENIAAGEATPIAVVAGWMASPGHRDNILSPSYRETGTGYVLDSSDSTNVRYSISFPCAATHQTGPFFRYWTQVFGTRNDVYPVVIAREAYSVSTCLVDVYAYGAGWAQQIRFSDDGVNYGNWQPFASNHTRNLVGSSTATVFMQIRSGGTILNASDSVNLNLSCDGSPAPNVVFSNGLE